MKKHRRSHPQSIATVLVAADGMASFGEANSLKHDPDETEGRKLYRQQADSLSNVQKAIAKRRVFSR